jgi:hypothetical protein
MKQINLKKNYLLIITSLFLSFNLFSQEKAFIKGKVVISGSASLGVYATKTHTEWNYYLLHKSTDTTDGAASGVYALNLEYGLTNWLGIGGRFGYSKYFTQADSSNNYIKPNVHGWDGDLTLNFHFVKTKHFDMPLQFAFGYSHVKYQTLNASNGIAEGGGLNYGISLVPRIYFGNHIGMFFNVGYASYNYPNLVLTDNSGIFNTLDYTFKLKANGFNLGIGLVAKFL